MCRYVVMLLYAHIHAFACQYMLIICVFLFSDMLKCAYMWTQVSGCMCIMSVCAYMCTYMYLLVWYVPAYLHMRVYVHVYIISMCLLVP